MLIYGEEIEPTPLCGRAPEFLSTPEDGDLQTDYLAHAQYMEKSRDGFPPLIYI